MGALLAYDTGELLGSRSKLNMVYGRNLGVQSLLKNDEKDNILQGSDYFSLGFNYRFNRLLKLSSTYYSDLDGHDDAYGALTAYYEFNPPRRLKQSRKNAGLLTGQIFLDENNDGKRQENEKGIPSARVKIKGSRIGLNADRFGHFTIQNLPIGIYRLEPDVTRLPLGYMAMSKFLPPVKIEDAQITELNIPIVQGHQLSGVVYLDENNNAKLDKGERRIENIGLELDQFESASTVFGQFTFDFLLPGDYRLKVQEETLPNNLMLAPEANQRVTLKAGAKRKVYVRLVDKAYYH
jgi:hypothetical protein